MSRFTFTLVFLGSALLVSAQTRQPSPSASPTPSADAARKAEADRIAQQRRAQARSLLLSLASDARSFREQSVRARTLARIADTLWDSDVERGRELFRKAWEAAAGADGETARRRHAEIQRLRSTTAEGH